MSVLFIDAAATDAWQWRIPLHDRTQPHLIRLAACLKTDAGAILDRFSLIIRPLPPWPPIAAEASARHHVTDGIAITEGRTLGSVMARLREMLRSADLIAAHSVEYHRRVLFRAWGDIATIPAPVLPPHFCTMLRSADIVQARLSSNGRWKWPTLGEAYAHFAGRPLALPDDPIERGAAIVDAVALIFAGIPANKREARAA